MNARRVLTTAAADADLEAAVDHYLSEGAGAAVDGLVSAFDQASRLIAEHPELGSSRYSDALGIPGLRTVSFVGFPYVAFYVAEASVVRIVRVLHERRDVPGSFHERV